MRVLTLALLLTLLPQQVKDGTVTLIARDAITQQGISGVFLTLTYKFPQEPAGASTSLLTDQQGRVTFNLPTGNYQMAAERQGYAIAKALQDVFIESGQRQNLEVSLNPLAAIAGRVLSANGDPLTLVEVSAASIEYRLGQSTLVSRGQAITDDRGEFRVFGLPPGEYYLKVNNSSRVGRVNPGDTPRTVFYPRVLNLGEARTIAIRGQSSDVGDIRIPSSRVFSISGTVSDESAGWNDRILAGVYLAPRGVNRLEESIPVPTEQSARLPRREVPFTIEGVKPGDYLLYAVVRTPGVRSPVFMEKAAITIEDRNITGLRIAVKPPVDLRTRVLVFDGGSVAMDGISIALLSRDPPPINTMATPAPATLNPLTGETVFTTANNTSLGIRVYGLCGDAYVADIRQGGRSVFKDAVIEANRSSNLVEIEIRTQGGIIQGTVRDTSNQVSPATVVLIPETGARTNLDLYKRTLTNANGEFTLRGIAPGSYEIFALSRAPENPIDDPSFIAQFESRMTTITTSQGATTRTSLRIVR